MKIEKLLQKALDGDVEARQELHQQVGSATVFVAPQGKIDVKATLGAIAYWRRHGSAPREWNDKPTCRFDDAFSDKVRRDPLDGYRPVTPGTVNDLWELSCFIDSKSVSGHKLVAALGYGLAHRMISGSALEIRLKIAQLIEGDDYPALVEAYRQMRDEPSGVSREATMNRVLSPPNYPIAPVHEPPAVQPRTTSPFDQRGQVVGVQVNVTGGQGGTDWTTGNQTALRQALMDGFGIGTIKQISFDLGIDYENFPQAKNGMARALVEYCWRHRKLDDLASEVHRLNPHAW